MKKKKLSIYCLIIVIGLLSLAVSGCKTNTTTTTITQTNTTTTIITTEPTITSDNVVVTYTPDNTEYSTFTAIGLLAYSFEYPVEYIIKGDQYMHVMLCPPEPTQTTTICITDISNVVVFNYIYIDISAFSDYTSTADIELGKSILENQKLEAIGYIKDFKVIYKRQVVVGGIKGWEAKYSFINYPRGFGVIDYDIPIYSIERIVFFDYDNVSFKVNLISDASIMDRTEKGFEHILQTFKLLE